ncbi:hypothetical protein OC844_004115 [Tilletia horrida]|nr:hypothetical protein OC844_004115 [Tilletia horrida]
MVPKYRAALTLMLVAFSVLAVPVQTTPTARALRGSALQDRSGIPPEASLLKDVIDAAPEAKAALADFHNHHQAALDLLLKPRPSGELSDKELTAIEAKMQEVRLATANVEIGNENEGPVTM